MTTQLLSPLHAKPANLIHHVSWQQLEEIDRALSILGRFKLAYLDETLEIMPLSDEHEEFKSTIGLLLDAYMRAAKIRFYKRGSPTLGTPEIGARGEPDESYNLDTRKPYPDLVVEVVRTSGGIDKLEIYRRMGVLEVWFWEDGVLSIYQLNNIESVIGYQKVSRSRLLPSLPLETFLRYVTYHDQYDAVTEFLAEIGR
ncbi:MAG: Uma2 family endonuclease [Timaviella obliquedivisa GSE-PSE-MK23-08B]|jgi:Uma2 family endonuclease|nr:Uma2 family endonuclease [Timaviella obliquedivisa GSE-PSE-MK23-08B]